MIETIQKIEKEILEFWTKNNTFQKSLERRKGSRKFVFYEGPPTANAPPGLHHVLVRTFKDAVCRYKTMRGFFVPRRAGWDTHGLPVELQVEKKLGLKNKKDIEKYGVAKFNEECRKSVWRYVQDWRDLTQKIGFWIDLDNPYITYTKEYMEKVWQVLGRIWEKGLLYKDFKVVPWCPRCGTALSSHEVAQGYETTKDLSLFVKFPISNPNSQNSNQYLLAWTTTPWTLPGNVALAVHPKIKYVKSKVGQEIYILAKSKVKEVLGEDAEILEEFLGEKLEKLKYEPLFKIKKLENEKSYQVYLADFVTEKEGTAIVHIAVMYGQDDFELGKKVGLPKHHTVTREGKFNDQVPYGLEGLYVKDKETENKILNILEQKNLLFKLDTYLHEYPFCWRCKTPLLYYATDSWFINMTKVKKELLANNQKINWIPEHFKKGRFGEWLLEAKDWALSRERYWGTPLPLWECQKCSHKVFIDSLEKLKAQKFTLNQYYLMRHGQTIYQTVKKNKIYPRPKEDDAVLTPLGKKQVKEAVLKLKDKKIDIIFASDLKRARQTAKIIAQKLKLKVIYDKRLRDLDFGQYHGGSKKEFLKAYPLQKVQLTQRIPGGESFFECGKRVMEFLKEINKEYSQKNILIISHGYPLWFLKEASTKGDFRGYRDEKFDLAEIKKLDYKVLPYNSYGKIDLHRPYVDEIEFLCPRCHSLMRRVPEVIDVWFDSGAMPFAQDQEAKLKPELFPADFICEAQDQTRGWFYTLLAVSTLLGFGPPYLNVLVTGLLLDETGEKMSKSKGNVVDPWLMLKKYGADAVRWYFITINQPSEPKLFSEKDIKERLNKFVMTLWNSYAFLALYCPKKVLESKFQISKSQISNLTLLDRWILSRLHKLIIQVTKNFDNFDFTAGCRKIENFLVQDLSQWYIRRSRNIFKRPKTKDQLLRTSKLLGYILIETCKLAAPFAPFICEKIFQELSKTKTSSIHLSDWPKANFKFINLKLEAKMDLVREIVTKALNLRLKAGIKVRQPLRKLSISNLRFPILKQKELIELIKEEVNVKEIEFSKDLKQEVELDTRITPELQAEGFLRELVRKIQALRKEKGLKPNEKIILELKLPQNSKEMVQDKIKELKTEVKASKINLKVAKKFEINIKK